LWDYALAAYRMDEVAPTCLALQDDFDVDVNLLLYAAWLAHREQCLGDEHLRAVDGQVAAWREGVIKPLRRLRRELRPLAPAAAIREEIKALELRAERHQQDTIYRYYQGVAPLPRGTHALAANLALVAGYCSRRDSGWERVVDRLHRLLSP